MLNIFIYYLNKNFYFYLLVKMLTKQILQVQVIPFELFTNSLSSSE